MAYSTWCRFEVKKREFICSVCVNSQSETDRWTGKRTEAELESVGRRWLLTHHAWGAYPPPPPTPCVCACELHYYRVVDARGSQLHDESIMGRLACDLEGILFPVFDRF